MKLKGKFILAIVAVLCSSYGLLMIYTSVLQNKLVIGQAEQQARMLHRQILLTRQWVADHQGLFFLQTEDVQANPFLNEPQITTGSGLTFVKRNPAMVTRELSEYAYEAGFCWFRVTSLKPVNPKNQPDPFERHSLQLFEKGASEQMVIDNGETGKVLRYAAPLHVKKSCLNCHAEHGYKVGDIRGALSITVPISWADQAISGNNRSIFLYGVLSVLAVVMVLYMLFNNLVAQPLKQLALTMEEFPEKAIDASKLPGGDDEIGQLSEEFIDLCNRLERSREALQAASEQGFRSEKLAALGQLTAGIAHEINNPLGGMRNCVKTMQEEPEDIALQQRYLPLLDKGLRRIEHTMRQLLNYGRIAPLQMMKTDIDAIINDSIELLKYRLRNIEVSLQLDLRREVCIDSEAVKQIIMNITLNGIQAMPDGGSLTIRTRSSSSHITLSFTDSGAGIAPDQLDKIFDPFFTTKEVGEGTGLGLAVTLSLIQRLEGDINVESKLGEGSTFTVTLPINLECMVATP